MKHEEYSYTPKRFKMLKKHLSWKYFSKYCELTTLHGFRYLTEKNRSILERIFWVTAIVIASFSSGQLVYKSIQKFESNDIVTRTEPLGTPIWNIPFPAITICNNNQLKSSKFKISETLKKPNLTELDKKKLAVAEMLCSTDAGEHNFLDPDVFLEMAADAAPSLTDTVENAIRIPDVSKSLLNFFQLTLTTNGICHTLNAMPNELLLKKNFFQVINDISSRRNENIDVDPEEFWDSENGYSSDSEDVYPWRVASDGIAGTTTIILKYNPADYDNECSRGSTGFALTVHNPIEHPTSYVTSKMYLHAGHIASIYVDSQMFTSGDSVKAWPPEKRGCYLPNERNLTFYNNYTQRNCDNECKSLTALHYCGCVAFYHPRNSSMPICGSNKWNCLWKSFGRSLAVLKQENAMYTRCNCLPSCNFVTYSTSTLSKKLTVARRSLHRKLISNYSERLRYSVVNLSYRTREVYLTNRIAHMTFTDFIGNVGGIMSLFLGFSFLSFIELIYFLSIRVLSNMWNIIKDKQKKAEKLQEERQINIHSISSKFTMLPNSQFQKQVRIVW